MIEYCTNLDKLIEAPVVNPRVPNSVYTKFVLCEEYTARVLMLCRKSIAPTTLPGDFLREGTHLRNE
jgi:hypothetical protein